MKTVLERLKANALQRYIGRLAQLRYLADMRESDGRYLHWGLSKVYGDENVSQAASEAHRAVFLDLLRTPFPKLAEEPVADTTDGFKGFLFDKDLTLLSPVGHHGGCKQHLRMVLYVLSRLAK